MCVVLRRSNVGLCRVAASSNRRMQTLLRGKGYDVTYHEFCGGHDTALWRGTLAQALAVMLPAPVAAS